MKSSSARKLGLKDREKIVKELLFTRPHDSFSIEAYLKSQISGLFKESSGMRKPKPRRKKLK